MNDITKFNDKYLKCVVTKYKSTTSDNALGNSGSLIVYQPASGNSINRNYIYLGSEFLASGYGFSTEAVQRKAEKIVREYDDQIDKLNKSDESLNNTIVEKYNDLLEKLKNYILENGGDISKTEITLNNYKIPTKDVILYGEEAQYKNLEVLDVTVKINGIESKNNEIILPFGSYIYEIYVLVNYKTNDSGGIGTLQVKHNLNNQSQSTIINYETNDSYTYDNESISGTIVYKKILDNPVLVDGYLENIIEKFFISVKETPSANYKPYPGIKEKYNINILSSGNAIKENIIEIVKHINVRPQFYMHYHNICNTISFNDGNCESKPLNSFVDYDETKLIINIGDTSSQYMYFAIPSAFKLRKLYVVKNNVEKYNWTGVVEVQDNVDMQVFYKYKATDGNYSIKHSLYRIKSETGYIDNVSVELDVLYNKVKQENDKEYTDTAQLKLITDKNENVSFNNTSIMNDEDFNNIYWINANNPENENELASLGKRLDRISENGTKKNK